MYKRGKNLYSISVFTDHKQRNELLFDGGTLCDVKERRGDVAMKCSIKKNPVLSLYITSDLCVYAVRVIYLTVERSESPVNNDAHIMWRPLPYKYLISSSPSCVRFDLFLSYVWSPLELCLDEIRWLKRVAVFCSAVISSGLISTIFVSSNSYIKNKQSSERVYTFHDGCVVSTMMPSGAQEIRREWGIYIPCRKED